MYIFGDIGFSVLRLDPAILIKCKVFDFRVRISQISIKYPNKCLYFLKVCVILNQKIQKHLWVFIADWKYLVLKSTFFAFRSNFGPIFLKSATSTQKYFFLRITNGLNTLQKYSQNSGYEMLIS